MDTHDTIPISVLGASGWPLPCLSMSLVTKKPNCVYKKDYLIVAKTIKNGEELLVYYGEDYEGIREEKGYCLDKNKHLDDHYPALENVKFPPFEIRRRVFNKLMNVIDKCSRKIRVEPIELISSPDLFDN